MIKIMPMNVTVLMHVGMLLVAIASNSLTWLTHTHDVVQAAHMLHPRGLELSMDTMY
jgi:hypothetical protein